MIYSEISYFYLKVNGDKLPKQISKQTKVVIDYIQDRYNITIVGMEAGRINDDYINNVFRFKVAYKHN